MTSFRKDTGASFPEARVPSARRIPRHRQILKRYFIFMNNHPAGAEFQVQSSGVRFLVEGKGFAVAVMET